MGKLGWMIRRLDLFPKLHETVPRISSLPTSIATLVFCFLFVLLMSSEIADYWSTNTISTVVVDSDRNGRPKINLDIDITGLDCKDFAVDFVDVAGEMNLGGMNGYRKLESTREPNIHGRKGCIIQGAVEINRVSGEFHAGLGSKTHAENQGSPGEKTNHVHHFQYPELFAFNASHHIHHLSFGDNFPKAEFPLNGVHYTVPEGEIHQYMYLIKIVPVVYKAYEQRINSYQYSFTLQKQIVDTGSPVFRQPGVFFQYEFSPYRVEYTEEYKSFWDMILRCCVLLGGLFIVLGWAGDFVDAIHRQGFRARQLSQSINTNTHNLLS